MRRMQSGGRRALVATLGSLFVVAALVVTAPAAGAAPKGGDAKAACKHGGWRNLVDDQGRPFRNQGQCVSAAVHGRVHRNLNAQVTGDFNGTESFDFGTNGCPFVFQVYEATYEAGSGGTGSFRTEGCVDFAGGLFSYAGTFTLTSPQGGTLTGSVSGTVDASGTGALDFTLAPGSSTGSLSGAAGTVQLTGTWFFLQDPGDAISGSLTGNLT